MAEDNVVYIGNKPVMSYVLAVATQLSNASEVTIKSRGRAISRAVDTAEIVRNKFISGLKIKDIQIGTETVTREDGTSMNISSLEITLSK